jgi:hypothetical protein
MSSGGWDCGRDLGLGNGMREREVQREFRWNGGGRTEWLMGKTWTHSSPSISDEVAAERERLQEGKKSIKLCLAICAKASEHLRDEVAAQQERLQEEKERTSLSAS